MSSARVPAGYTRATLYVFQPIQYVDPGDWTGYQLTDDSLFSSPAHPMAQATYADNPLLWPDQSMPPYWDGLYQLRMCFSGPGKTPWTSSYPAAVIKVTGKTWTLVQGGGSSCTDGKAESVETFLLPKSETAVPKPPGYADTTGQRADRRRDHTTPTSTTPTTTTPTPRRPRPRRQLHDPHFHDAHFHDDHFHDAHSTTPTPRPLLPRPLLPRPPLPRPTTSTTPTTTPLRLRPLSGTPRRPLWPPAAHLRPPRSHVE